MTTNHETRLGTKKSPFLNLTLATTLIISGGAVAYFAIDNASPRNRTYLKDGITFEQGWDGVSWQTVRKAGMARLNL